MSTALYNPNSDIQTEWDTTGVDHYTEIDEGTTPVLADHVQTKGGGDIDEWGFATPGESGINFIRAHIYAETGSNATFLISLQQGGVERASFQVPVGQSQQWFSCQWDNPSGDLSALTIEVTHTKSGGGGPTYSTVYTAYLEVDYTEIQEFPYSGNIPLTSTPSYLSSVIMTYAGIAPLMTTPSYDSLLDRTYDGALPVGCVPSYLSALEKGYSGIVSLAVLPSYLSALEKGYNGVISPNLLPSYLSILDGAYDGTIPVAISPGYDSKVEVIYAGAVAVGILPSYSSIVEMLYGGQVPVLVVPSASYSLESVQEFVYSGQVDIGLLSSYLSTLEKGYQGQISLILLSGYDSIVDRIYLGEIPLVVVPSRLSALEMEYDGSAALVIVPESIYSLEESGTEFVYSGSVFVFVLPRYVLVAEGEVRMDSRYPHCLRCGGPLGVHAGIRGPNVQYHNYECRLGLEHPDYD